MSGSAPDTSDTAGQRRRTPIARFPSIFVELAPWGWLASRLQPAPPMLVDPDSSLQVRGADSLDDAELLSFLFSRGKPGAVSVEVARQLLHRAGGLARMARQGENELCRAPGIGPVRARRLLALLALARRLAERPIPRGTSVTEPRQVYESVRARLGRSTQELFVVLLLDGRLRKLAEVEVCRGGRNAVSVLPRDVFEPALREGASAVILVHNHPSGDPTPSPEDVALTERLIAAGELLGIAVRDHVVVGDGRFASLAELGHLEGAPMGFALPGSESGAAEPWVIPAARGGRPRWPPRSAPRPGAGACARDELFDCLAAAQEFRERVLSISAGWGHDVIREDACSAAFAAVEGVAVAVALGGAEAADELGQAMARLEFCALAAGASGQQEWHEIELEARTLQERLGRARWPDGPDRGPRWRRSPA